MGDINIRHVKVAETVVILLFLCELLPTEGCRLRYLKAGACKRIFGFKTEEVI
jgi:hypothetical protein